MSVGTRFMRMRALFAQQPNHILSRPFVFPATTFRAPIHRHLGRTAATTTTARVQGNWRSWMIATTAVVGVVSWQLGNTLVEAESPVKPYVVIDSDSKTEFPLYIRSEDGSPARLLGLGVRKITFLKVQVYVVGLYLKESDLNDHNSRFRILPEVQKFQQHDRVSSDIAYRAMIQTPIEMVLRIVPVRNTNGPHLRDGFTRNLTQAAKEQKLSEPENEDAMDGIMEFKALFPKGSINTGQAMIFRKLPNGTMTISLDDDILGTVQNTWLIENFFLGYLKGDNPISEKARESISQGIQNLLLQ
ncbi:hypothetical protein BGZ76_002058 [Entomortierella beljakovae]|nr:hypothetical protein BGZ76_002058 [Entomortierella beljakovae]